MPIICGLAHTLARGLSTAVPVQYGQGGPKVATLCLDPVLLSYFFRKGSITFVR